MNSQTNTTTASNIVGKAEALIALQFKRTRQPRVKMAGFETPSGRHIAIERDLQGITVWTENLYRPGSNTGGELYPRDRTRHHNLEAHAPRLFTGNAAVKWRLPDLASVEALLRWYATA